MNFARCSTPLGRSYEGVCSSYLARCVPGGSGGSGSGGTRVKCWLQRGSFRVLGGEEFDLRPVLAIGGGGGGAPVRGIVREGGARGKEKGGVGGGNTLVFGCRRREMDYHYGEEWESLARNSKDNPGANAPFEIINAFSQEGRARVYVQSRLKDFDLVKHVVEDRGGIAIAGGSGMAKAVREEIVRLLAVGVFGGDEKKAEGLVRKMERRGFFAVEAWD